MNLQQDKTSYGRLEESQDADIELNTPTCRKTTKQRRNEHRTHNTHGNSSEITPLQSMAFVNPELVHNDTMDRLNKYKHGSAIIQPWPVQYQKHTSEILGHEQRPKRSADESPQRSHRGTAAHERRAGGGNKNTENIYLISIVPRE